MAICDRLQEFFPPEKDESFLKLSQMKYELSQSVDEYFRQKLSLSGRIGLNEASIIQSLNLGLPDRFQNRTDLRQTESAREWLEIARIIFSLKVKSGGAHQNMVSKSSQINPVHEKTKGAQLPLGQDNKNVPRNPCIICQKKFRQPFNYHFHKDCPVRDDASTIHCKSSLPDESGKSPSC